MMVTTPNRSRTEKRARRCLSAGHCQGTIRKDNSCRPVRRTMVSRSSPAHPAARCSGTAPASPPGQTGRKTATSPCRRHSRPPENTPKRQPQAGVRKWSVPKVPPQVSLRAQYTLFPRADWISSEARMPLLLAVSRKGLTSTMSMEISFLLSAMASAARKASRGVRPL